MLEERHALLGGGARRAAIDTASVALVAAPLLAVPSRAIIAPSSAAWFSPCR
jgi:hypothetical protein